MYLFIYYKSVSATAAIIISKRSLNAHNKINIRGYVGTQFIYLFNRIIACKCSVPLYNYLPHTQSYRYVYVYC